MNIDEFDKISPYGVLVENIGHIHSPYLRDIAKMGYTQYQYSLSLLLQTVDTYIEQFEKVNSDVNVSQLKQAMSGKVSIFDIYIATEQSRAMLIAALSLFISGKITWDEAHKQFLINENKGQDGKTYVDGYINRDNYGAFLKFCLPLCNVKQEDIPEEHPKFKSEKDRQFYEQYMKRKKKQKKSSHSDPMFEFPNMISVICTYHNSLNYTNIYDLTILQLYDTFWRVIKKHQLEMVETNHSVWGGKYNQKEWLEINNK